MVASLEPAPPRLLPDVRLSELVVAFREPRSAPRRTDLADGRPPLTDDSLGTAGAHPCRISVSEESLREVCVSAASRWAGADERPEVKLISRNSNFVYEVARLNSPSLICRIFGGKSFGASGAYENALVQELAIHGLAPSVKDIITTDHCGVNFDLGRVEELLPGVALASMLSEPNIDLTTICHFVGIELSRLHSVLDEISSYGRLASLFPVPHEAVVGSRGRQWRHTAATALKASALPSDPLWGPLARGALEAAAGWEQLLEGAGGGLRSRHSGRVVFGHFDPTPGNLVVSGTATSPTAARLIDFEWAGPNVAVYDFAKFALSTRMAMRVAPCAVTEELLRRAVRSMAAGYLSHPSVSNCRTADDLDLETTLFVDDVFRYVPVVAAVNLFSNLNHALEEGQLRDPPRTADRRLPDGGFNWLAHAQNHLSLFLLSMDQQP